MLYFWEIIISYSYSKYLNIVNVHMELHAISVKAASSQFEIQTESGADRILLSDCSVTLQLKHL